MTTIVYAIDATDLTDDEFIDLVDDIDERVVMHLIQSQKCRSAQFERKTITDDYVVICDGDRYLDNTHAHANSTHVVTIKRSVR